MSTSTLIKFPIKNKHGFTLIELLVVISIIGLLSTVVLSSVQKARTDAKWRAFERQLVEIRTAVQLYRTNNNGNWPTKISTEGSLQDLITELKSLGFYNSNKIEYPIGNGGIQSNVCGGAKADTYNSCSCGNGDYLNTYYTIYFNDVNNSILPTKLPILFYDGVVSSDPNGLGGYYYCIEL